MSERDTEQTTVSLTPEEVIQKIAHIAAVVGWQAGVGGMETAGVFISVLAAHPEKIQPFLSGELAPVDDEALLRAEMGCLTWHALNGKVMAPAAARAALRIRDH